jgi:tetratricopeptide (TPR) repeat protein
MNRLQKTLGSIAAIALSGCAGADGLHWSSNTDSPPLAIGAYEQPGPEAQLMYHILVGEIAGKRGQLDTALENYQIAARASSDPRLTERAVGIALFIQNDAAALEMAKRWYALEPGNIQARQALALALLRNALVAEAVEQLEAVRKASGQDGQEGFAIVSALLGQVNDKTVVFKVMRTLRERQPHSLFALYYYSLAAWGVRDYQQALAALDTALKLNPKWVPAHLQRARVMMDRGDTEAALKKLAAAVSATPRDIKLRAGYARLLVMAKQFEQARQQFRVLAKQNPKDTDNLIALGLLAAEARQFDDAERYFRTVLKLGKRIMEMYYELGKLEEARGHYRKARDWYARISYGDERYLNAQVRVGAMLARLGDFEAMNAHFINIRRDNPQNEAVLYISEAEILSEENRYQAAFDLLTQALEQDADNQDLLYSRALAAEKINRLDVLEQDLKSIIEADPKNGQALNALGYTLADRTDRYQEALGYLERAIVLLPDDAAVLDSMGWVHYRLGRYQESLKYLHRAYELNKDGEIAAHLVEVLWITGQQEEARKTWQRAVEKDPSSEHLRKVKERFGL